MVAALMWATRSTSPGLRPDSSPQTRSLPSNSGRNGASRLLQTWSAISQHVCSTAASSGPYTGGRPWPGGSAARGDGPRSSLMAYFRLYPVAAQNSSRIQPFCSRPDRRYLIATAAA